MTSADAQRISALEEAIAEARSRAQWAIVENERAHGIHTTCAPGQFDPSPLSAEEARLRAQLQHLQQAPGARAMGASEGETTVAIVGLTILALYVGSTVASYYLVRDMAPKKSAKSYGAGAAAANLFFPIIGPVVVGLAAAGAQGKR